MTNRGILEVAETSMQVNKGVLQGYFKILFVYNEVLQPCKIVLLTYNGILFVYNEIL